MSRRLGAPVVWMAAALGCWSTVQPVSAATYTVTSAADGADANTGDGLCVASGGGCTLRAAIEQANATAGADTIAFALPGAGTPTIAPTQSLPIVSGVVTIDGSTQPSGRVVLDGAAAGAGASGLVLQASGCTLKGLAIGRFPGHGILLFNANGTSITDTFVGVAADGVGVAGNGQTGVFIGASSVTVSGSMIGYNAGAGVVVSSTRTANRVTQTRFLSNGGLGIDLGNDGIVNPNDLRDLDGGANDLQNGPFLTQALGGGSLVVLGGIGSTPNTTYTIEFFRSPSCDASGFGEGAVYLGSTSATTDGNGNTTFSVPLPGAGIDPDTITATATAPNGSTSEFSNCVTVGLPEVTTTTILPATTTTVVPVTTTTLLSGTTTTLVPGTTTTLVPVTTTTLVPGTTTTLVPVTTTTLVPGTTTTLVPGTTTTLVPGTTTTIVSVTTTTGSATTSTTGNTTTTTTEPAIQTGPLPACVRDPGGVAVDDVGNVYVSDRAQGSVTVFDGVTGENSTFAAGLSEPRDVEIRGCDILVAERSNVVEVRLGLSGRILDFDFTPAANARVTVRAASGQSSKTFATNADGRFAITLDFVPCELQPALYLTVQTIPTPDRASRTREIVVLVRAGTARRPFGQTYTEVVLPAP